VTELVSQEEQAGQPPLPYVELTPKSPPLQITEAGPLPEPPPPPPFNREAALAGLHAAFSLLTDEELEVARLRMLGVPYADISEEIGVVEEEAEKLWKQARRKLGMAMFRGRSVTPPATPPPSSPGTPPGIGGTSPA
jgi:DNA-directed RNA polymerase specialized sigma24 family protein